MNWKTLFRLAIRAGLDKIVIRAIELLIHRLITNDPVHDAEIDKICADCLDTAIDEEDAQGRP